MEALSPHHPVFFSPPPRDLAELRVEPSPSAIAFSAPCGAAAGRKRRCLLPASSPRKRTLLELLPFGSASPPSPKPLPRQSSADAAPPSQPRGVGSPASDFSFPSAIPWTGGNGGGSIFAFVENAATTQSPTGSDTSALSFLAPSGPPVTPTGSSTSGGIVFLPSPTPKQPTAPTAPTIGGCSSFLSSPGMLTVPSAGPTANGGFFFSASPEQSLTPMGSNASGGLAFLSSEPSLSPREYEDSGAVASLPTTTPARARGITESSAVRLSSSPWPALGHTDYPSSPAFVFSASRKSASTVCKSGAGSASKKRSRPDLRAATARSRSQRQREEKQLAAPPPQKVAKTSVLTTGEASHYTILSGSSARPCCTFFASTAKARKQEAEKASSEASHSSPPGSRCTFVASPRRPQESDKANKREREVEVSSMAREGPATLAVPCSRSTEVVVRVICTCGVRKEFCFDQCH